MSIDQYIKAAIRTERVPTFDIAHPEVRRRFETESAAFEVSVSAYTSSHDGVLGTTAVRLLHSALGMSTEISELVGALRKGDPVNIVEELGDVMWYWAVGMDALGLTTLQPLRSMLQIQDYRDGMPLVDAICAWADLVRRHVVHGKPLAINAGEVLLDVYRNVGLLALAHGADMRVVMEKNIAKLRVRFPEKYDGVRFENRDLEAERVALAASAAVPALGEGYDVTVRNAPVCNCGITGSRAALIVCPVHGS